MRKPILVLVACALALLAIGPHPRYLEELRIGGGLGSTPDGGADFSANGDISTDGDLRVRGLVHHTVGFVDDSLVGHWALNDGAGTLARDLSASGANGSITVGSGGWSDDSPFRHAYNFAASKIDCGTDACYDLLGPQTITAWIKPSSWGGGTVGQIVSKSAGGSFNDGFYIYATDTALILKRKFSTTSGRWRSAANSIGLNRWQFVAVTYDHSSVAADPVFYINGQPSAMTEIAAPVGTAQADAGAALLIGNWNGLSYEFAGRIADVRIYNRILSAAEVQALYRAAPESPTLQALTTLGNATVGGDVTLSGGDVIAGSAAGTRGVLTLWDGSGGAAPGTIKMASPNGTVWYLFVTDAGVLRVHNALPTANANGAAVGSQS